MIKQQTTCDRCGGTHLSVPRHLGMIKTTLPDGWNGHSHTGWQQSIPDGVHICAGCSEQVVSVAREQEKRMRELISGGTDEV